MFIKIGLGLGFGTILVLDEGQTGQKTAFLNNK